MSNISTIDYADTFEVFIETSSIKYNILTDDLQELWFVEDIYSFCMKGKLTFIDRTGMFEFGGMSGTETIHIVYGQKDNKKSVSFHTHNTSITLINSTDYRIETTLIDTSFKYLNYHTYSLGYSTDTSYTDIVKDINRKYFDVDDYQILEECKETLPYFDTGNTTPAENIKWLLGRCSGRTSGQSGYLLYQNTTEKQWNLVTLETLLQQTNKMYIDSKDEVYIYDDVSTSYVNKIQSFRVKGISNRDLPELSRGYMLGYDPMTKVFHHRAYSYIDALDRYTILGQHSLFEDIQLFPYLNSESQAINTGETDANIMSNIWYGKWIRKYCTQQLIEVNVKGHEERYAGGMIEVVWKSIDKQEEQINQSLNGKFLIKSITHHFTHTSTPKYQQSMVLIKNGFGEKQEGSFIKAKKTNI